MKKTGASPSRKIPGALAAVAGVLLLLPLAGLDAFLLNVLTVGFLMAVYTGSWDIVGGVAGQVSLGHALFFGAAPYGCALLTSLAGWPFPLAAAAALLLAAAAGAAAGALSAPLKGPFVALLTLALGEAAHEYFLGQTFFSPEGAYSAARFRADALAAMAEITAAGRVPLLVGGTKLYYKALAEGLADLPQADPALRAEIEADAARRGWPALHTDLAALDPETAARLKPNDSQRIQRAIEVCRLTGRPMAELLAAGRDGEPPYRFLRMGLAPSDRLVLHERIARRFREMLDAGLVGEVEMLRAKYRLHPDLPSMRC
ncbi:MAG: tRNA (adenosine(37)-N6)-dimethylallyltransferase MiaA, partial [Deltaproteobacteria bacterium]|nr:tRNA (adenosine(37)-N6)-dimethylallyltransferase MiaA [Deltaproteobacteria bacterium]